MSLEGKRISELTEVSRVNKSSKLPIDTGGEEALSITLENLMESGVNAAIETLQFITWVDVLPPTGSTKYLYAVPREEVDKDGKKIAALYLWDGSAWRGAGAFSLNIDPDTLATKTELAGYLPLASKAVANGVASLDENAKVPVAQIPDLSSTYATINSLATVATSGSYEDLINKPTIPSAVTETTVSGWGFTKNTGTVTGVKINGTTKNPTNGIVDVGTVITQHQDISGKQDKITSTNKLSADLVADGTTNKVVTASEKAAWNGKQDTISDLATIRSGASAGATAVQPDDLAKVATSGSYTDLTNKPTIPTVNNGTLTIQKNGTNVATFTANQSTASTANIEVPTKLSELTDDLGSSPVHTHSQYSTVANTVTNVVAGSTADKINVTKNGSTSTITINNVANATNATKATKDADGNTISTTYAKKSTLATVATSGMYSDLTGTPGVATADTLGLVKPDGTTITVTEDGTISAEVNIPITSLPSESGNISLQSNAVYKLSINGATTFAPQTPADTTIHNQIKVFLSVSGTPTINWGTSNYFNKTAIEIKEGNYVVYFDYDPNLSAWTVGAMAVGGAE